MEKRKIQSHVDGRSLELPIFDGERVAPDQELFAEMLRSALRAEDAGIRIGEIFTRPMKGVSPLPQKMAHLDEQGLGTLTKDGTVLHNHHYLLVEGEDGQRYRGQDLPKGTWVTGKREADALRRLKLVVQDSFLERGFHLLRVKYPGRSSMVTHIPFARELEGPARQVWIEGKAYKGTEFDCSLLNAELRNHFKRPVNFVRLDELIEAGDEALPEGVTTKVRANEGAPLHILSEASIKKAEAKALEMKGEDGLAKLPRRPWRPDLVLSGRNGELVAHLEDEIALWALPMHGGVAFIQTLRGTPRCAGMQGYYGVVRSYRPGDPRDRRDGVKAPRPLFGVNAAVWTERFGQGGGKIELGQGVIPVAARPAFEDRWEGKTL